MVSKQLNLLFSFLASATLLAGCASQPSTTTTEADPYEAMNRQIYAFNSSLDQYVLLPVTKGYRAVTPEVVRTGVNNFFENMREPGYGINNALQGKGNESIESVFRFLVNSTFGVAGLFDVASWIGMQKHEQDFGQTLGTWGMGAGPYLVLPVLGPSSARDFWRWPVGVATNPLTYMVGDDDWATALALGTGDAINARSQMIDAGLDELRANTVDEYSAVRDAFLKLREQSIRGQQQSSEQELQQLTPLPLDDEE